MHYVAYLFDIPFLFGSHLADENLVVWLHHLADGSDHAHRSVVAAGCHEGVIFLAEDAGEIVLGARLAVAARDAHHCEVWHGAENASCIVDITPVYPFFHRNEYDVGDDERYE